MESHGDDEEDELALLIKNFHKFLKKEGKQTKFGVSGSKASKGKNFIKLLDFSNKKGVQCGECKGYGHIESKNTNMCKKKSKAITNVWSDKDSDRS